MIYQSLDTPNLAILTSLAYISELGKIKFPGSPPVGFYTHQKVTFYLVPYMFLKQNKQKLLEKEGSLRLYMTASLAMQRYSLRAHVE